MSTVQDDANATLWARRDLVGTYAHRDLKPPEVLVLIRHVETFRGRVLELGCGAGRLTGHLVTIAEHVHAIDTNEAMLEHTRERWPEATLERRDLRALQALPPGSFDVVIASSNVIDVVGDAERGAVLDACRRLLRPRGLLAFSSHNIAWAPQRTVALDPRVALRERGWLRTGHMLTRLPRELRNRRRMRRHERFEDDYAILNDVSHDWQGLHYYISRDAQERQLARHGFELLDCLDGDGRDVPAGESAQHSSDLWYVAHPAERSGGAA